MSRHDNVIGIVWSIVVVIALLAFMAGLVIVATEPTAANAYRWIMAALFIGGSILWLTSFHSAALRRFFKR